MKIKQTLDRRTMREIERLLKARRAQLREAMRSAIGRRDPNEVARSADPMTWATDTLESEIQIALVDLQSRQVAQIETALERLDRREYGICHDCGEFIGIERLRALPFAQRCRPCQSRAELRARRAAEPEAAVIAAADGGGDDDT